MKQGNLESHTESGIECQAWARNKPHRPKHRPRRYKSQANYCRNPDGDPKGKNLFYFQEKKFFKVLGATLLILTFVLNIVKFRNVLSFRISTKTMILIITKMTTGLLMIPRIRIITKDMAVF